MTFGWEYPPGSMRGSGIYEHEITRFVECDAELIEDPERVCGFEGEVDVNIDDWGHGEWLCPNCGATHDWDDPGPDDFDDGDWMRDEI